MSLLVKAYNWPCNDLIFTVPTLCTHPAVEEVWNRKSNTSGITPLHGAAVYDNDDVVKLLIDNMTIKMPQDEKGGSPLHTSARYGQLDVTNILLDAVENSSSYITQHAYKQHDYYTPLHIAAGRIKISPWIMRAIVELFLDRIVGNKNPKGAFTIYVCIFWSFLAKVSLFNLVFGHLNPKLTSVFCVSHVPGGPIRPTTQPVWTLFLFKSI